MMNDYKMITVGGRTFQLNRMTALVGSRIVSLLLSASFKLQQGAPQDTTTDTKAEADFAALTPEEKANASIASMWIMAGSTLPAEMYAQIQRHCLDTCRLSLREDSPAIPVLTSNGRWAEKELETDLTTVNQLIVEALQFNLAPFFTESASKSAGATARDLSQPRSLPATDSYSAR